MSQSIDDAIFKNVTLYTEISHNNNNSDNF